MMRTVHLNPLERQMAVTLEMTDLEYAEVKLTIHDARPITEAIADILRPHRRRVSNKDQQMVFKIVRALRAAGWTPP